MSDSRRSSLRWRLTRSLVGLGLVSVILVAAVNFVVVRDLLDRRTRSQVETLRETRRDSVELGIARLIDRVSVLGSDPGIAVALEDLANGYASLDDELDDDQLAELADAYDEVVEPYDAAGVDRPPISDLLPTTTAGRYVQYQYVGANSAPSDDRSSLLDAGDGSTYSAAHAEHHEYLRTVVQSIGATDLLLIGLDSNEVVYSVDKHVDLGTDALNGPYAETGLGKVWRELGSASVNDAVIADIEFYLPNVSAPIVHMAAAVRSSTELVGAVVITLRTEELTDVVTAGQQWELLGLGDTGEAYIVGSDLRLRTVPRLWFENPEQYLERFDSAGGDERIAELMRLTGSPVLLQEVDNRAVRAAFEGESFVGDVSNYLGRSTFAASTPLDVADLGWILVTEQETSETRSELTRFVVSIGILLAALLPILAAIGVVLARVLARPVAPLVEAARRIADGDYETEVPELAKNELGDVGQQLRAVAAEMRAQDESVAAEEERIVGMLTSVLPPALVERVRRGEHDVADVVDTATVVAVAVSGVPDPAAGQDGVLEMTERLGETMRRVADRHGVEQVQATLDLRLFVVGRGAPDTRAELATTFAVDVVGAVRALGDDFGVEVRARAGLCAGLVGSGMVGSQQMAFGIWGECVGRAAQLAAAAAPSQVLVDSGVFDELSDDWVIDERVTDLDDRIADAVAIEVAADVTERGD